MSDFPKLYGEHPGCNYLAHTACNKCGWVRPILVPESRDIEKRVVSEIDAIFGERDLLVEAIREIESLMSLISASTPEHQKACEFLAKVKK